MFSKKTSVGVENKEFEVENKTIVAFYCFLVIK